MHIAYIGLGSNLQDPKSQLQRAFTELGQMPGTRMIACSSLYRSAPLGYADQPDYANAVAKIATTLPPHDLLQTLLQIEQQHGRLRSFRNAPRTLDLDVLLYDDMQIHEHGLTIPHPQMHARTFVLQPLLEIAPEIVIPGIGRAEMALETCDDPASEILAA